MRVTILGCGASSGVPVIGCDCRVCRSSNPRNKRRRASVLVESADTCLLVDASPDLRAQLLDAGASRLDGILFTHDHADHTHGIDDLRSVNRVINQPLEAFGRAEDLAAIEARFGYAFSPRRVVHGWYKPQLVARPVDGRFRVGGIDVVPFDQRHGRKTTLGYRFGTLAYSTDVNEFSDVAFAALDGVLTWIVDCQSPGVNPVHGYLTLVKQWIARVKPSRAILTHMGHEMDYDRICDELPDGVELGYDGMVLT